MPHRGENPGDSPPAQRERVRENLPRDLSDRKLSKKMRPLSRQGAVVVILFLHCCARADANAGALLITARNGENEVQIRQSYYDENGPAHTFERKDIESRNLSAECGDGFRRCSQITVSVAASADSAAAERSYVAILQLDDALALLKFSAGRLSESELHFVGLGNYMCSPAEVIPIKGEYYVVCLNSSQASARILKLNLDTENIAKSRIPELEYPHFRFLHAVTNFLHVELPNKTGHYIFFAAGHRLFYVTPFDLIVGEVDVDLEGHAKLGGRGCLAAELGYTGGWEMIVYCHDDRAVYVYLNYERIFAVVDFAVDGRPYICPNPEVYLGVFSGASYIQYGNRSTREAKDFEVSMGVYDNGVCLGSEDTTLFVFADRERGTRLLNATGGFIESLSDSTCINYPCRPLVALENGLLVLREKRQGDWHISLFDSHDNFSLALEVPHSQADLMAVIENVQLATPNTPETPTQEQEHVSHETPTDNRSKKSDLPYKLIGSVVGVIVVKVLVIATVALLLWRRRRGLGSCSSTKPIAEEGRAVQQVEDPPQAQPTSSQTGFMQESYSSGDVREDDHLTTPDLPLADDRVTKEVTKKQARSPLADKNVIES